MSSLQRPGAVMKTHNPVRMNSVYAQLEVIGAIGLTKGARRATRAVSGRWYLALPSCLAPADDSYLVPLELADKPQLTEELDLAYGGFQKSICPTHSLHWLAVGKMDLVRLQVKLDEGFVILPADI